MGDLTGSQFLGVSDFLRGLQFLHKKINLKSEIFNSRKCLYTKMLFSVITKNLDWEIVAKNLVTFKRWDGVKYQKF